MITDIKKDNLDQLKILLEKKVEEFNCHAYIDSDPIQIPHIFKKNEDIEIAAFLSASIAWGQRKTIIRNARTLMKYMDDAPYDFITNFEEADLKIFDHFKHRTLNSKDCVSILKSLKNIYKKHGGLKGIFENNYLDSASIHKTLIKFREIFLEVEHEKHVEKHVSNVLKNSAAKRLNLFLRWMVRKDLVGVDFGLWNKIPMSALLIPLDVHSGNTSRILGLLKSKQDNWNSVVELTENLRIFDPDDPVKYDYALFGIGVFDKYNGIYPPQFTNYSE